MNKSIVFNFLVIFVITQGGCNHNETLFHSSSSGRSTPLLLISIDGFMTDYLERNSTPNFDRFMENGVTAEGMIPVFPTKTFPTHFSMVTGLYVENHGIISNRFYDEKLEAQFAFGPRNSPNDERWWGGEPIWITAEKQGKTAATVFWPGSEASFSGIKPTKWLNYDGALPDSARIDSVIAWLDPAGAVQADISTLYFSFVDSRAHSFGPRSPEVAEAVQQMDGLLGYLFERMESTGLTGQLNVMLVSDHGMAELSRERVILLEERINLADVDVMDWSPVALIRPRKGKTREIYQQLKDGENHYRVYLKEEIPDRFHFREHERIPDIVMIADVGYTITTKQGLERTGLQAATHGFDNREPEMAAFFAANGPDFLSGEHVPAFESVHLYELMAHLLELEPAPNDGRLDSLRHVLRQSKMSEG